MVCISDELQDAWIELINQGKFPLCKKWHGKYWTPLHVAAQHGHHEVIKFIETKEPNLNPWAPTSRTMRGDQGPEIVQGVHLEPPVYIAARYGNVEILKHLLRNIPAIGVPQTIATGDFKIWIDRWVSLVLGISMECEFVKCEEFLDMIADTGSDITDKMITYHKKNWPKRNCCLRTISHYEYCAKNERKCSCATNNIMPKSSYDIHKKHVNECLIKNPAFKPCPYYGCFHFKVIFHHLKNCNVQYCYQCLPIKKNLEKNLFW